MVDVRIEYPISLARRATPQQRRRRTPPRRRALETPFAGKVQVLQVLQVRLEHGGRRRTETTPSTGERHAAARRQSLVGFG